MKPSILGHLPTAFGGRMFAQEEKGGNVMAEQPMETTLRTALWQQFGAAIDMLENALVACPETLWQGHLWIDSEGPEYGTFWDITYHTLCWLDLYLTGCSVEEFTPPAPFKKRSDDVIPKQPYTKDEL